jgi:hypothetical protein
LRSPLVLALICQDPGETDERVIRKSGHRFSVRSRAK